MNKIAIIGLGYVGLPLARLFATKYPVVGYDINQKRIDQLQKGHDSTLEVDDTDLKAVLLDRNPFAFSSPPETDTERSDVLSLPAQSGAEGSKCRSLSVWISNCDLMLYHRDAQRCAEVHRVFLIILWSYHY